jgi:hypothetical protein
VLHHHQKALEPLQMYVDQHYCCGRRPYLTKGPGGWSSTPLLSLAAAAFSTTTRPLTPRHNLASDGASTRRDYKPTKTVKTSATTQTATAPDPVSAKNDGQRRGWSSPRSNTTADVRSFHTNDWTKTTTTKIKQQHSTKPSQIPLTKKFVDPAN